MPTHATNLWPYCWLSTAMVMGFSQKPWTCATAFISVPAPNPCFAKLVSTRPLSGVQARKADGEEESKKDETDDFKPSSCNVLGTSLRPCCTNVRGTGIGTGFYRNGFCSTGDQDQGRHTVCVEVTNDFLEYSAAVGNDLSTAIPEYHFPGLKDGDRWCLCAARWTQAYQAGKAPKLFLLSSHEKTLDYAPLDILREFAIDREEADGVLLKLNEQRDMLNRLL